ncbi:MAG: hypothetical protein AB1346_14190 [Thermodesulfobacteriota bacterium]
MKGPGYFMAVFGTPEPPDKDSVDSGRFFLGQRGADTPGERGDLMLLVHSADDDRFMTATGVGVILTKTGGFIFYRYLPFSSPIPGSRLEEAFDKNDANTLKGIRPNSYWLFDLSGESFRNAAGGSSVDWAKAGGRE